MMLNELDISTFTYPELNELKGRIELRMEEMRELGVPALRERFAEEAAVLGVTLEEVISSNKKRPGRPRKPRAQAIEEQLDAGP